MAAVNNERIRVHAIAYVAAGAAAVVKLFWV
jgi:hypothetical protein